MTAATLWTKHRRIAYAIAQGYYLPGADADDVQQEALIGLWHACRAYRTDGYASFNAFATLVIRRHLNSCLRAATRGRQLVLTDAARDQDMPYLHQVTDQADDRERLSAILHTIHTDLTPLERRCVIGIACGLTYPELGPYKQVDNALMRGRAKLRAAA